MLIISVASAETGWAVRSPYVENEMVFRSGAAAEQAARRLAHALAVRGEYVELRVYLRDGKLAGRFVCPPPGPSVANQGAAGMQANLGTRRATRRPEP